MIPANESDLALVVTAVADLRRSPRHQAELVSQRWLGEIVRIDRCRSHWALVRGWDDYRGWVRCWSLRRVTEAQARAWERAACLTVRGHGAVARLHDGAAQPLPWGARLAPAGDAPRCRVRLPDGRAARLDRRLLRRPKKRSGVAAIIETARAARGAPYLWGGTTPWGFDCSGLVQWSFALSGLALPRDAREQWEALGPIHDAPRAGDLLFFGRGDVRHVALVTRPPRFVHAYGCVEETSLEERPELARFLMGASRPLHRGGRARRGRRR